MRQTPGNRLDNLADLEGRSSEVCAFFDLDHTVLDGSSGMLFGTYMWRRGLLPLRQALSIVRGGLLYVVGGADFTNGDFRLGLFGITPEPRWFMHGLFA